MSQRFVSTPARCLRSLGTNSLRWHAVVCLALLTRVYAAEWHVGPDGRDENPGTLEKPFASLQIAIERAAQNDVIHLATGRYTEAGLVINKSLELIGQGKTQTFLQAAARPNEATNRVFRVPPSVSVTMRDLTVRHGRTPNGQGRQSNTKRHGGGIYNEGSLIMTRCTVGQNRTGDGSDLVFPDTARQGGLGGGIYNAGTLELHQCLIEKNITGSGGLGKKATVAGQGGNGGGIYNQGKLLVNECMIIRNQTGKGGDAQGGSFGGIGGHGGGIFNQATATIKGSCLAWNQTGESGKQCLESEANGGGLATGRTGKTTLSNCTLSGNRAVNWGGGMYFFANATATIIYTTVAYNQSENAGGGASSRSRGVYLSHCLIAANQAADSPDTFGTFISRGANLVGINTLASGFERSSQPGDIIGRLQRPYDPLLCPLQDNGGPTWTHALSPGSPAIDAGHDRIVPSRVAQFDQRGEEFPRTVATIGDIGAYEFGHPILTVHNDTIVVPIDTPVDALLGRVPAWREDIPDAPLRFELAPQSTSVAAVHRNTGEITLQRSLHNIGDHDLEVTIQVSDLTVNPPAPPIPVQISLHPGPPLAP